MNKRIIIGIILVILAGAIAGYFAYITDNPKDSKDNFAKEINRNLSPENRKIFEDRLAEAQQKLKDAQTNEDKWGWEMQVGYNLQALGRLAEAQTAFEQAISLNPNDQGGYVALFQVKQERGDFDGARESIKTAIEKNQTNPGLWKSYILLEIEKFHSSNETISSLYNEALTKTGNSIDMVTTYADWLEKSGNLQGAIEYWQKAIAIYPTNKKIYQAEIDRINKLK